MKKLLPILIVFLLALSGCGAFVSGSGSEEAQHSSAPEPELLTDAVTQAQVFHHHCEDSDTYTVTGEALDLLRSWANGLELTPCAGDFPEREGPNDVEGGESWTVTPAESSASSFRYMNHGPEACYIHMDDLWYLVSNPSDPPITISEEELSEEHRWDLIPMVMVNGQLYYDTGRRNNDELRCGVMDGEITSSVEGWEVPAEDGQSNFGSGYGYQWGSKEGEIEVNIEDNWLVFETRPRDGSTVLFDGRQYSADGLSEETLEWLDWYNGLSKEEQLAVSAIPTELVPEGEVITAEDAGEP